MEFIDTLGLDWRLLLAQIVNFFILLWILKRFAYGPVIAALEKRRDRIAQAEKNAQRIEENRKKSEEDREQVLKQARTEAQRIVTQSEAQGKKLQEQLTASAKKDVERIVSDAHAEIAQAKEKMLIDARREVAGMVLAASAKVLEREIDEKENAALIDAALDELQKAKKNA